MEAVTMKFVSRKPVGFDIDPRSEELYCPHRNRSCCDECANAYGNIVEVYGTHYWLRNQAEVVEFLAEIGEQLEDEAE